MIHWSLSLKLPLRNPVYRTGIRLSIPDCGIEKRFPRPVDMHGGKSGIQINLIGWEISIVHPYLHIEVIDIIVHPILVHTDVCCTSKNFPFH